MQNLTDQKNSAMMCSAGDIDRINDTLKKNKEQSCQTSSDQQSSNESLPLPKKWEPQKVEKVKTKKPKDLRHKMAYVLRGDNVWNPLLSYPKNLACPCLSGKKFKKCHYDLLPKVVSKKEALTYRIAMQNPKNIRFTGEEIKSENAAPVDEVL